MVNNIFSVTHQGFDALAIAVFRYQYQHNPVYQQWVNLLNIIPAAVTSPGEIPFMPVSFFKTHKVYAAAEPPDITFESSGTTQSSNSQHHVRHLDLYMKSCIKGFEELYGDLANYAILGLLPSYLERKGSSLVVMVEEFIKRSNDARSGFYLYEHDRLSHTLRELESEQKKTLLIGVTFGLLDFVAQYPLRLRYTIVMETGGMKGRRKEMIRSEVHDILRKGFATDNVHSEYGMTEMLSQAYSMGNGLFKPVPWLKVLVRDEEDPLSISGIGRGIINIIDLANVYSCSFLATDDAGLIYPDGTFEVLGRVDNSDIRGCSLMLA
ncbi:acyl transferase [Segetibacter sp. 3557_3]|nr:acyl transferase [Segetibacter sp. 3557_3]